MTVHTAGGAAAGRAARHGSPRLGALAVAGSALAAALVLTLGGASPVAAHAQLVSSSPGAGEQLSVSPTEIRLVFSEPVEAAYTSLDLLDGQGRALAAGVGSPDPADGRQLVAGIPQPLPDGAYTISWRAVSAADGHATQGFLTFAVGGGPLPPGSASGGSATSGDVHGGHGVTTAVLESVGRSLGILGFMAAAGLAVFGWIVRSGGTPTPLRLPEGQAVGLLAAAVGALLLAVTAASTASSAGSSDLIQYLASGRNGQLLLLRFGLAVGGFLAVLSFTLRDRPNLWLGFAAGLAGIVLTAAAGHAAAFASPVPLLNQVVHVGAASVWMGGLLGFGILLVAGPRPASLERLVPRFSAVALVSIALVALTGAYADWIETRDPISVASPYQLVLLGKIGLFVAALAVGAVNYLRGGGALGGPFGFKRRILAEAALAIAVVGASGLLASGSPPGGVRPVGVQPAVSSAGQELGATLAILPGHAGPNQLIVDGVTVPETDTLVLILQRLDQDLGTTRIPLRVGAAGNAVASGVPLPDGSRWDASLAVVEPSGAEAGRSRFVFGIGANGLTEGEQVPPVDPTIAVAGVLLLGAVLSLSFGLAGGTLPRTDRRWSRIGLVSGGGVAAVLGVAMLIGGGAIR
ncbi:MAG: copper transport protein [Chloroflexota bacterium]|nr:copper transport protein [Chloroflexota bacterium]